MPLTATTKAAMFAAETDEIILVLLTLEHASFTQPIRVVNDREDITSNSNLFIAFPFDIILPTQAEDAPPKARLTIDNVSQEIITQIRAAGLTPITVTIQVVRKAAPNTIEAEWPPMQLRTVQANVSSVSGDLEVEDLIREPFPEATFNPAYFPGMFG